jgi:hypothetical protein
MTELHKIFLIPIYYGHLGKHKIRQRDQILAILRVSEETYVSQKSQTSVFSVKQGRL